MNVLLERLHHKVSQLLRHYHVIVSLTQIARISRKRFVCAFIREKEVNVSGRRQEGVYPKTEHIERQRDAARHQLFLWTEKEALGMPITLTVTNQPPPIDDDVPSDLSSFYQAYMRTILGSVFQLFRHQTSVFRHIMANKEVFLIAGTAAGKTLSVSVPLFFKLATKRIRRILLVYPTIALMEDQRRVMDGLARFTGCDIGVIQGGMSRAELVATLGKPVILATPDALYWFFRKNVKYSSLLIYGLSLIDEFVLDEAHLFNGLMLQNLSRLKSRLQLLGERIGKRARWHILTATPTPQLRQLTQGEEVRGQSKCSDVTVTFYRPARTYIESVTQVDRAIRSALADGAKKTLVVFNSADAAHRFFERIRGREGNAELSTPHQLKFGQVQWQLFERWLTQEPGLGGLKDEIGKALEREATPYLSDLPEHVQATLPTDTFIRSASEQVDRLSTVMRRLVTAAAQDTQIDFFSAVQTRLGKAPKGLRELWRVLLDDNSIPLSPESLLTRLSTWSETLIAELERGCTAERFPVTSPAFPEMQLALRRAGVGLALAQVLSRELATRIDLPKDDDAYPVTAKAVLAKQYVSLSWFSLAIADQSRVQTLFERLSQALEEKRLRVETRHMTVWAQPSRSGEDPEVRVQRGTPESSEPSGGEEGESPDQVSIPVIVYTGKMTKAERDGLIEAFAQLERAILISTSAVEVGVDFAADVLITEECDGNAFLQRFGRVGRRSEIMGRVIVFLKRQDTYVLLHAQPRRMSREMFSDVIAHPVSGIFPRRSYVEYSLFVDVVHYLINAQIGEIGGWLNHQMFGPEVTELARVFQEAGLAFNYGLRSTLPGISLKGGAGGGEPFYLLRKIENRELLPSSSPFEMARTEMPYIEFLRARPVSEAIVMDTQATLEASEVLFWLRGQRWQALTGAGVANDYAMLFSLTPPLRNGHTYRQILEALRQEILEDFSRFTGKLREARGQRLAQHLLRVGEALPLFFEPHGQFLLGQGSVYLRRLATDGTVDVVEDEQGNALLIPEQCWLLLLGYSREEAEKMLAATSCQGLEEVIYAWQTLELIDTHGVLLLDRSAGACITVYQRLVDYVTGQV